MSTERTYSIPSLLCRGLEMSVSAFASDEAAALDVLA